MRHTALMSTPASLYHRHRFPTEIISHCVWLYFRFALSFRDVQETLAMRGVSLSYETVREWCLKFGQTYANGLPTSLLARAPNGTWMRCFSNQRTRSLLMAGSRPGWRRIDILLQSQ